MHKELWLPFSFSDIVGTPFEQVLKTLLRDEVISKARLSPEVVFLFILDVNV